MNRKELISKIAEVLREKDIRKELPKTKTVLHISDDNGNHSDFTVQKPEKGVVYTVTDVTYIIDTCLAVIEESIKRGEDISIQGFGSLFLKHRAARRTRHPDTGKLVEIKDHFIPKFTFGSSLRVAAQVYESSLKKEDYDAD